LILERNSYDLVRSPLKEMIEAEAEHASQALKRKHFAQEMAGWWSDDLSAMAALKVLSRRPEDGRRLTTGHIAEGVLSDEDYIEVLRQGSFGPKDLEEVRITVTDASLQSRIVEQSCHGNAPGLDAQLWCRRRYQAEQSLRARNVRVRVVTTLGRTRQ
jgi:hypothetical protein